MRNSGNYQLLMSARKVRPLVENAVKNAPPQFKLPILLAGGLVVVGAAVVIFIAEIFDKSNS